MPPPLTPAERQAILDRYHDTTLPRTLGAIARDTGRGKATVHRTLTAAGLELDRSETKKATDARLTDIAARKARIAQRLVGAAEAFLDDLDAGRLEHAARKRELVTAVAIVVDKVIVLEKDANGAADRVEVAVTRWDERHLSADAPA